MKILKSGKNPVLFYSSNNPNNRVSFRKAVMDGIADDGGLFAPDRIPLLGDAFFERLPDLTIGETAFEILRHFAADLTENELSGIVERTFTFDAPLVRVSKQLHVLELFHGPTLAFKDFGARFLANTMSLLTRDAKKETVILVATSGDTGSAVGRGFYGLHGIRVGLLYPSGMVSEIQERQLTTIGGNVQAFEIDGTFDDCQRLVKQAFRDTELKTLYRLSSANSINIARLLPQAVYYFRAYAQLEERGMDPVVIVPSGNFGNLTAGIIAGRMGLPVKRFVAAVNRNSVFPDYLETGIYRQRAAVQTLSNAMDVGDPSNFVRILELFDRDYDAIKKSIRSISIDDRQTLDGIRKMHSSYGYTIDPHGAVGYMAWEYLHEEWGDAYPVVLLETAHPAKFRDSVEKAIGTGIEMPGRLAASSGEEKRAIPVPADYDTFKRKLMRHLVS